MNRRVYLRFRTCRANRELIRKGMEKKAAELKAAGKADEIPQAAVVVEKAVTKEAGVPEATEIPGAARAQPSADADGASQGCLPGLRR